MISTITNLSKIDKRNILKVALVLFLIIVSVFIRIKSMTVPLVSEMNSFRGAQTAITIQDYFNHGFSIFKYKTPVFGPPWQVPLEFPIYQVSVYIFMKLFRMTNIDLGCRIVSFIYFYFSAFALLILCKMKFSIPKVYWTIFVVYIFTPFSLAWSRVALPDYASVFFGLMYIIFFDVWMNHSKKNVNLKFFIAIISGILCSLCKSTSLFPVVVILAFSIVYSLYEDFISNNPINIKSIINYCRNKWFSLLNIFLLCIIPFIIGLLWVKYTDFIKNQFQYTQWLTSESLKSWNYGTQLQKINFNAWSVIFNRIHEYFAPYLLICLLPISIYALYHLQFKIKARIFFLSLPIAVFFTFFCLINLYQVHDYYLIGVSPYISVLFGFGLYYVVFELTKKKLLLKCVFLLFALISFAQPHEYYKYVFYNKDSEPNFYTKIGNYIQESTGKDEYIIVQDQQWSSAQLYAANRRGFMIIGKDFIYDNEMFINNNFTTYIKHQESEFDSIILNSFDLTLLKNIDGWEIYRLGSKIPDILNGHALIFINAGSEVENVKEMVADIPYDLNTIYNGIHYGYEGKSSVSIYGDDMRHSNRYGSSFSYRFENIPQDQGTFSLVLVSDEIWKNAPGQREFNVIIETDHNKFIIEKLDPYMLKSKKGVFTFDLPSTSTLLVTFNTREDLLQYGTDSLAFINLIGLVPK